MFYGFVFAGSPPELACKTTETRGREMSLNILVTGSSGFIGGQLVTRLQYQGHNVLGMGRRNLDRDDYFTHDLAEPIPDSIGRQFDVVIHAAARSSPWGTHSQFNRDNVVATQNVIDFCDRLGRPKLIFLSSSSVYYRNEHQFHLDEESPLPKKFVNRYAATKRQAERLVEQYPGAWSILRPRAVFGPGDTVLLPRIIDAARRRRLPLLVNADGPVIGDLIYIENLLDCIEHVATRGTTGVINLTNNEPVPIQTFLFDVFDQLKIPRPTRQLSAAVAMRIAWGLETFHRVLIPYREPAITRFGVHVFRFSKTFNVSKMRSLLGPPRVNLDDAKSLTVEWFQKTIGTFE